jgi:hypothetical protein
MTRTEPRGCEVGFHLWPCICANLLNANLRYVGVLNLLANAETIV